MKKILKIALISLFCFSMLLGISSCRAPETTEDLMAEYVEPIADSIDGGYKDFDIVATIKNASGTVIQETKIILYRSADQPFLFVSNDNPATPGVDEQMLIHITADNVVNQVYRVNAGDLNATNSEMSDEELNQRIASIYDQYFKAVLPKNADSISDHGRIYLKFFGTYSNYEIRYSSDLGAEDENATLYDCLLRFNTKTDKIHIFQAAYGTGDDLVSMEIVYNYPMLGGNVFTKEVPTIDKMIQAAHIDTVAPSEETPTESAETTEDTTPAEPENTNENEPINQESLEPENQNEGNPPAQEPKEAETN